MIKIVYVEDEARNGFTFEQYTTLMRTKGIENSLLIYKTGEEALKAIPQVVPDIIFVDVGLPGMSGLELVRQLRANPKLQPATGILPIVALAAYSAPIDLRTVQDAGCSDLLVKPVRYHSVEDIIRRYFMPSF